LGFGGRPKGADEKEILNASAHGSRSCLRSQRMKTKKVLPIKLVVVSLEKKVAPGGTVAGF
jgi:hypothetical protein